MSFSLKDKFDMFVRDCNEKLAKKRTSDLNDLENCIENTRKAFDIDKSPEWQSLLDNLELNKCDYCKRPSSSAICNDCQIKLTEQKIEDELYEEFKKKAKEEINKELSEHYIPKNVIGNFTDLYWHINSDIGWTASLIDMRYIEPLEKGKRLPPYPIIYVTLDNLQKLYKELKDQQNYFTRNCLGTFIGGDVTLIGTLISKEKWIDNYLEYRSDIKSDEAKEELKKIYLDTLSTHDETTNEFFAQREENHRPRIYNEMIKDMRKAYKEVKKYISPSDAEYRMFRHEEDDE